MTNLIGEVLSIIEWNNVIGIPHLYADHGLLLFMFILYYSYGAGSSETRDKRVGKANTNLPLWAKRILFLYKPNPFAKKTIIYQAMLVSITLLIFIFSLFITIEGIRMLIILSHSITTFF